VASWVRRVARGQKDMVQSFEDQGGKLFSGDWLCLFSQVDLQYLKVYYSLFETLNKNVSLLCYYKQILCSLANPFTARKCPNSVLTLFRLD